MTRDDLVRFFAPHLPVTIRSMAGGRTIHAEGATVALEAAGGLYIRADRETQPFFLEHRCEPLSYQRAGGTLATLRYYRVPPAAFTEERLRMQFVAAAIAIAKRSSVRRQLTQKMVEKRLRKRDG